MDFEYTTEGELVAEQLEAKAERERREAIAAGDRDLPLQVGRIAFEPQQHGSVTFPPPGAKPISPASIKLAPAMDELLGWCKTHSAEVTWRDEDVLVRARVAGTVRQLARPTFRAAVQRLIELEAR